MTLVNIITSAIATDNYREIQKAFKYAKEQGYTMEYVKANSPKNELVHQLTRVLEFESRPINNSESEQHQAQAELNAHISQQANEVAPENTTETPDNSEPELVTPEFYEHLWYHDKQQSIYRRDIKRTLSVRNVDFNKDETTESLERKLVNSEPAPTQVNNTVNFRKPPAPRRVSRRASRFMSYLAA